MNMNQRVIVQSELVPDYNGLEGRVISSVTDPITNVTQYKVYCEDTPANRKVLERIGAPYIRLDAIWAFWFIESELQSA